MSTIRIRVIGPDGPTDIIPVEIRNPAEYPLSHKEFLTCDGNICEVKKVDCDERGIYFDVLDVTRIHWP